MARKLGSLQFPGIPVVAIGRRGDLEKVIKAMRTIGLMMTVNQLGDCARFRRMLPAGEAVEFSEVEIRERSRTTEGARVE
jgi:hypothetical protein